MDENLKDSTFNVTYFAALKRPELAFKLMIQAVLDPAVEVSILRDEQKVISVPAITDFSLKTPP
jgi:hypothetical protein